MNRARLVIALICACLLLTSQIVAAPPTADSILNVHQENRSKLATLHLELAHVEEWTEAARKSYRNQAEQLEAAIKAIESGAEIPQEIRSAMTAEQFVASIRQQVQTSRLLSDNERFEQRYEIFIDGEDYQVRTRISTDPVEENWRFPDAPITKSSLTADYSPIRIFSRSNRRTPAAQIWPGKPHPNSSAYAMVSSKHVHETQNLRLPPYMWALDPRVDSQHAYDMFFSAPAERYRVASTEERDGRTLTIVDVAVPTSLKGGSLGANGAVETWSIAYYCRAWLDLKQGATPIELRIWPRKEGMKFEEVVSTTPNRILKSVNIRQLSNGAYYPEVVVAEELGLDPDVPQPTADEWIEIQKGNRPEPPSVVHRRETWKCSTIEADFEHHDEFFILSFPDGQAFFDLDAQQVIGSLEPREPVKAGEPAPPLAIARWLDGQHRSLDELRGKVVVLDFWGLWCGACRSAIPGLKQIQEKYKDRPVVFISIHTAENDGESLVERIKDYVREEEWKYLAAIDAGTMIENSETSNAYGVTGYPTQVIIGADGLVVYSSAVAPEGLEGIFGKSDDELTADDRVLAEAFEKKMFEEAGVKWPVPENISREEQIQLLARVNLFHMSRYIDAALSKTRE